MQSSNSDFGSLWSGIGFVLCGKPLAASMGEVTEIITLPRYTPVPGSKSWVMGIANVRGTLLPIIDLEKFYGGALVGNRRNHRVLIVNYQGTSTGLVVSKLSGMLHISKDAFTGDQLESAEMLTDFVDSSFEHSGETWFRFSPDRLFASPEFTNASQSLVPAGNSDDEAAA